MQEPIPRPILHSSSLHPHTAYQAVGFLLFAVLCISKALFVYLRALLRTAVQRGWTEDMGMGWGWKAMR